MLEISGLLMRIVKKTKATIEINIVFSLEKNKLCTGSAVGLRLSLVALFVFVLF